MWRAAAIDKAFITILNMSLTGSFAIAVICLARVLLRKAPKLISYWLWAAAGLRLAFPFSIESAFSLIPFKAQAIPADIGARIISPNISAQSVPRIDSGIAFIDNAIGGVITSPAPMGNAANTLHIWIIAGTCIWLIGAAIMLAYGLASYLKLKQKIDSCAGAGENLIETENIQSPFILGILTPVIYIPAGLAQREREYIVLHERTHLRRHDYIIKLAAYFILSVHWFNPLAWAAFLLMGVDMEMACDEFVIKELGGELKKDYSMSLLSLATVPRAVNVSPLAFGDDGVKKRIKNILSFKKPSRIVVILAVVFMMLLSLGLIFSRAGAGDINQTATAGNGIKNTNSGNVDKLADNSDANTTAGDNGASVASNGIANNVAGDNFASATGNGFVNASTSDNGASATGNGDDSTTTNDNADIKAKGTVGIPTGYAGSDGVIEIAGFYDANGNFSDLAAAIPDTDGEKLFAVNAGDILVVGELRYKVLIETLALALYTQPTMDLAVRWWTDYLDSWAESGKVELIAR